MNEADVIREIQTRVPLFQPYREDVEDQLTYAIISDLGRYICSSQEHGANEELQQGLDCLEFILGTDYSDARNLVMDCLEGLCECPHTDEIAAVFKAQTRYIWVENIAPRRQWRT